VAIIRNGQGVQELKAGESGEVILDHTPFYAESGGRLVIRDGFIQTITILCCRGYGVLFADSGGAGASGCRKTRRCQWATESMLW